MDQQEDIQALEAQKEIERILGAIKAEIPIFMKSISEHKLSAEKSSGNGRTKHNNVNKKKRD